MNKNLSNVKKIYTDESKHFAKSTACSFINLIGRRRSEVINEFKTRVKRDDLAWKVALAEFGAEGLKRGVMNSEDIKTSIVEKLNVLSYVSPFIEYALVNDNGYNLLNKTRLPKDIFLKLKYAAYNDDGSFVYLKWFSDREYPVYVRYFPYFNWIIATIINIDAIDNKLKHDWLNMLEGYRYGKNNEGYVVVYFLDNPGENKKACDIKVLVDSLNPSRKGECLNRSVYDLDRIRKSNGVFVFMGNGDSKRVIFLKYYKPWHWIVGSGIVLKNMFKTIDIQKNKIIEQMGLNVENLIMFLGGIGLFIVVLTFFFVEFSKRKTNRILTSLGRSLKEHNSLVEEKPVFKEFEVIISYFSEAIDRINTYENDFLKAFISILEARDVYTKGHSQRVAFYSKRIAKKLGYDDKQQEEIYRAGLLHDIGKVGIPDAVLLKPGRLTDNEYRIMKQHPVISYEILARSKRFKHLAVWARQHHERCDGSGYPDGLLCNEISEEGKIIAIADIFDALTTTRPYRKAFSVEKAIEILEMENVDKGIFSSVKDVLIDSIKEVGNVEIEFMSEQLDKIRNELFSYDFMTGLKMWIAFRKSLSEFVDVKAPFVLYRVNIKNVGYINYKFGEDVGDEIIVKTAEALKEFGKEEELFKMELLCRAYADVFFMARRIKTNDPIVLFEEESSTIRSYLMERVFSSVVSNGLNNDKKIIGLEDYLDFEVCFALYPNNGKSVEEVIYKVENSCG